MIGPEFLSTFRLKPIETIREWENARLWMVYLEAELHRRKREAEEEGLLQRNVGAVQDSAAADSEAAVLESVSAVLDSMESMDSAVSNSADLLESVSAGLDSEASVLESVSAVLDSNISGSRLTVNPLSENFSEDEERFRGKNGQRKMPDHLTFEFTLSEVLEILGVFTKHFDRHYWFSESGDVIKEIRYRMKIREFRNRDLVEEIGSKGYVSDILRRRKPLTLRTARVFRDFFDIPAEWLLSDYSTEDVL
jgi:HTH-type transcriptional regulator / antitoxin HigA